MWISDGLLVDAPSSSNLKKQKQKASISTLGDSSFNQMKEIPTNQSTSLLEASVTEDPRKSQKASSEDSLDELLLRRWRRVYLAGLPFSLGDPVAGIAKKSNKKSPKDPLDDAFEKMIPSDLATLVMTTLLAETNSALSGQQSGSFKAVPSGYFLIH